MRARSVDTIELWIWSCLLERTGASPASTPAKWMVSSQKKEWGL